VFAANAFALLGLRALFFLLSGLLERLVYLSTGLAAILAFIGLKLGVHFVHIQHPAVPEIPTALSLGVIVMTLVVTAAASWLKGAVSPTAREELQPGAVGERVRRRGLRRAEVRKRGLRQPLSPPSTDFSSPG
jgi:tellurite resistance protein TerC